MGSSPEPSDPSTAQAEPARRGVRRRPRRAAAGRRSFATTLKTLDVLAASGAQISVRVTDLDAGTAVLAGDEFVTLPIAGLGVVPVLIEVAAGIESGALDAGQPIERTRVAGGEVGGLWSRLRTTTLPLGDLAVLAAAAGDPLAANALLDRVGLDAVRARVAALGLRRTALLDRFRDVRGPDDAPHFALGSARELADTFAALVNTEVVSPAVSAQVAEWLSLGQDLSLVAAATGLDPFAHDDDEHGLLFVNKTGRAAGVRVEAGVLAGPRAGVSYALIVCFDDLSIAHRLRAHEAFRTLGVDLMEYIH